VFTPEAKDTGDGSASIEARRALPVEEAFAILTGGDRRPLLVLRECLTCTGTDDALLTRQTDNEKTMLYSRWFHCVKLPPDVLEADHPFHALFGGDDPGHLFVSRWNGTDRRDLNGQQSRTELWDVLEERLAHDYRSKPDKPLKELFRILDGYDLVDTRIAELESRMDEAIEEEGPDSSKAARLRKELIDLRAELSDLREKAVRVSDLKLNSERKPK